jgi:nucleolar protein 58
MLVLFETPAGFALFKLHDDSKLEKPDSLVDLFQNVDKAKKLVSLVDFHKFSGTTEALQATTALLEGRMDSTLENFIRSSVVQKGIQATLAVSDKKLGTHISEVFKNVEVLNHGPIMELMRCIRSQLNILLSKEQIDMQQMALGLSHSLGRYKMKFSPDKVDVMIVQAISLLDDLDKEINTYAMRVKEWYGWHFPELARLLSDNIVYARLVKALGQRSNINEVDLTDVLDENLVGVVKNAATLSMGTDVAVEDMKHIQDLADQVIEIASYRDELNAYIKARMSAIAPNLTVLVGELVGARLIAHAGSLINLAKHPASTIQILGAEKALFRALKTKKATPKYGLIYHASLIGQTGTKNRGRVSRVLANKAALGCRVDALGDETTKKIGMESLKSVLRAMGAEGKTATIGAVPVSKYIAGEVPNTYNNAEDIKMEIEEQNQDDRGSKRKRESHGGNDRKEKKQKK